MGEVGPEGIPQSSGNIPQQPLWSQQSLIWASVVGRDINRIPAAVAVGTASADGLDAASSIFFRQRLQPQLQRFLLLSTTSH